MKNSIKSLLIILVFVFQYELSAQTPDNSEPVLKKSDVENFINNYKNIISDFNELDIEYSPESDLNSFIESLSNVEEVNKIVKKYGFSDVNEFVLKTWAIAACYASIKMDTDGSSEMQKAIEEIKNSNRMTEEEKEAAIQQIEQVMGAVGAAFTSAANEKDVETVRPYVDKLDTILNEDQ